MTWFQHAKAAAVERSARTGRVEVPIGRVESNGASVIVWVYDNTIDLQVLCLVGEAGEQLDAVHSVVADGETSAHIDLDQADARGLIELVEQAIDVCAAGLAEDMNNRASARDG